MIAVISTGGKQYKVAEGDVIRVEKLDGVEAGGTVTFDQVLLLATEDGATVEMGAPNVEGASVAATVKEQARGKKLDVRKFKAKSRYYKRYGHRQPYTEVEITGISSK